jgi:hypothetical protein
MALGNKISIMWRGMEMQDLYDDWAQELRDFTLGAIDLGIKKSRDLDNAPTLGMFKNFCREYNPADTVVKIGRKFSPEERANNMQRLDAIKRMLAGNLKMKTGN